VSNISKYGALAGAIVVVLGTAGFVAFKMRSHGGDGNPAQMPGGRGMPAAVNAANGANAGTPQKQFYAYKPDPNVHAGLPLRPMDEEILEAINNESFEEKDMLDLFPQKPYRVRLVGSKKEHWIMGAMIDLERDGKWDESWEMKPDMLVRRLTEDSGRPKSEAAIFQLRPGHWLPY
jgi:hypothetical protein